MSAVPVSLRVNRDYLDSVLDAVSDAVFTVDRDYVITSFNRAAEAVTGLRRTDVVGQHCYDMLHSTVCDYVSECPMTRLFDSRGDGLGDGELNIVHGLQPGASLRVTVHPLIDRGNVIGGLEALRPLTPGDGQWFERTGQEPRPEPEMPLLDATERHVIEEVLRRYRGNRGKVCEELGISRTTLWRKMQRLGIRTPRSHMKRS